MSCVLAPSSCRQPLRRPWPRSRPRRWARPNGLLPPAAVFALIPSLPRCALARLTERMIDRMDEMDDDPDLEPEEDRCGAADDGCGAAHDGHGNIVWGTREEDPGTLKPIYGANQSAGPINHVEANREHRAREAELVRSPTGGWTLRK